MNGEDVRDVLDVLRSQGACCDCEVLYNVAENSRLKARYWIIVTPIQKKIDIDIESGISNESADSTPGWNEIFAALDEADFPDDFLSDREQLIADSREPLTEE